MTVKELLAKKGKDVVSMESESTVEDAIRSMNSRKISAILITQNGTPVGIFTERDVVRGYIATDGKAFKDIMLKDVMTTNLIVADIQDELDSVTSVMVDRNIRHLPVAEKGKIVGMLSVRDIIQTQMNKLITEIHYLKDYIL